MKKGFFLIILTIGLVWGRSGIEKITDGEFVAGLAKTLAKFASKNPYPWYKSFLETVAIPNAELYAYLTLVGEIFTALAIVVTCSHLLTAAKIHRWCFPLLLAGLSIGAFLNLNFWLASAWMGPAGDNLNLLMFAIEGIGIYYSYQLLKKSP